METKTKTTRKKLAIIAASCLSLGGSILMTSALFDPLPVFAQTSTTTYIDALKTETAKVDDVASGVYKVAGGSIAFGAGALIVKRLVYA